MKKIIILGVVFLFVVMTIYPNQVNSTTLINQKEKPAELFFGLKSYISITWDENESLKPIMPNSPTRILSLNYSYWVTWGIFGRLINYYLREIKYIGFVYINFEIIDKPEYCNAWLNNNELQFGFPEKPNIKDSIHDNIFINLNENAPAYEEFNITIQATMDLEIRGPLGFITILSPAITIVNITFIPDYWGVVSYVTPEGNLLETPPLIEKQLPIEVENLANGKTIIETEILEVPDDFIIYFDPEELILDVGEEKTLYIKVIAPSNFSGRETIRTKYTPHFYYNYSLTGWSEIILFNFYYYPS